MYIIDVYNVYRVLLVSGLQMHKRRRAEDNVFSLT